MAAAERLTPFSHSAIQPFSHSAIQPFSHSAIQPFSHSAIQPFSHSAIQPFSTRCARCSGRKGTTRVSSAVEAPDELLQYHKPPRKTRLHASRVDRGNCDHRS